MTPGTCVHILGCGHRSQICEYALSSILSIHKVIAFVLKNYNAAVDFYLFYDGTVDMQI